MRNYCIQLGQNDWIETTAIVTYVSEINTRTSRGSRRTDYDIYYTYAINGKEYDGKIDDINRSFPIGDKINIKYDPNEPDKSTHITEPAISVLIMGVIFGVCGLIWIGSHVRSIISEKKVQGDVE